MKSVRLHKRRLPGPSLIKCSIYINYSFLSKSLGTSKPLSHPQPNGKSYSIPGGKLVTCVIVYQKQKTLYITLFFSGKKQGVEDSQATQILFVKASSLWFFYSQLSKIEPNNSMLLSMSQATCLATWLQRQERPTRSPQFIQSYILFVLATK